MEIRNLLAKAKVIIKNYPNMLIAGSLGRFLLEYKKGVLDAKVNNKKINYESYTDSFTGAKPSDIDLLCEDENFDFKKFLSNMRKAGLDIDQNKVSTSDDIVISSIEFNNHIVRYNKFYQFFIYSSNLMHEIQVHIFDVNREGKNCDKIIDYNNTKFNIHFGDDNYMFTKIFKNEYDKLLSQQRKESVI